MSAHRGVLRFDAFTLDLSRYIVLRGDEELPLRPKTFDVLSYLAKHPGRVVTKDELFDAVWGGAARSDDTLVQCIKHIRQTLGASGHSVIKAVPKRGYLFTAEILDTAPASTAITVPNATPQSPSAFPGTRFLPSVLGRSHHASLLVAGALLLAASIGIWALWSRPGAQASPHAQVSHFAILGRALLDHEHSAQANGEAITLFDKALALDPNSIPALLGYARAMVVHVTDGWAPREDHSMRFNQAAAALERVTKLDPANARALHLRGFLWRAQGDPDRAFEAFHQALVLNPDNAWTHAEIGRVKIELGRADEAIADIETAIRLSPAEPRLYNWYYWAGMAAVHAGMSERALQLLLKWREPNHLYARFSSPWLAVAYAEAGRQEEGRAILAEHLAHIPSFTIATFDRDFPGRNPIVATQRRRVAGVLRRLGVPEGRAQTGSLR